MKPSARDVKMAKEWWDSVDWASDYAGNRRALLPPLLAQAREEGRLEGIEEVAKEIRGLYVGKHHRYGDACEHCTIERIQELLLTACEPPRALAKGGKP